MQVFLIGYMGSGKTSIGKKLASKLELEFIDLDKAIEERKGKSVTEIFASEGEEVFREEESKLLRSMGSKKSFVMATGGGTPCFHQNMAWMNDRGLTVYLEMTADALSQRLLNSRSNRPIISGKDETEFKGFVSAHLEERELYYKQAGLVVDGKDLKGRLDHLVELILEV